MRNVLTNSEVKELFNKVASIDISQAINVLAELSFENEDVAYAIVTFSKAIIKEMDWQVDIRGLLNKTDMLEVI